MLTIIIVVIVVFGLQEVVPAIEVGAIEQESSGGRSEENPLALIADLIAV